MKPVFTWVWKHLQTGSRIFCRVQWCGHFVHYLRSPVFAHQAGNGPTGGLQGCSFQVIWGKVDSCGWMDTLGRRWPALSDRMDAPASPSCIWRNSASLEHCARSQRAISQVCAVMNRKASDLEIRSLLLIEKFWNKSYNIYVSQGEPQTLVNEKGKFFLSVNFPWQQFLATHLSLLDDHGDHRQE